MISDSAKGLLLALACYAFFAGSDAFIKSSGGSAHIFEIGFFISLFSAVPILLGRPKNERWRDAFIIQNKFKVHLRAISGLCAGMCAIYAFTHLELAEAYALIFLIPAFTTILSIFTLGENVRWRRWGAIILGFVGVLVVVRPGFEEVKSAHAAGLGVAVFGAISITTLRSIAGREKQTSILSVVFMYSMVFYTIAMIPVFKSLDITTILPLAASGILAGLASITMIQAANLIPASKIAPTQYSQIIWAIVLGYVFFDEIPDLLTLVGLSIITASGILIFIREEERGTPRKRITLFRNRL